MTADFARQLLAQWLEEAATAAEAKARRAERAAAALASPSAPYGIAIRRQAQAHAAAAQVYRDHAARPFLVDSALVPANAAPDLSALAVVPRDQLLELQRLVQVALGEVAP